MSLIARECSEHGRDVGPPGMVEVILGKCWYCKRELVDVEYVPAEQLQGAVAENEKLREALTGLMRESRVWLEPPGMRANPAMSAARTALGGQ